MVLSEAATYIHGALQKVNFSPHDYECEGFRFQLLTFFYKQQIGKVGESRGLYFPSYVLT